MNAQADTSLKHAQLLAGEPRFQRVDVTTPQGSYRLDSPAEIGELAALGKLEAEKAEILSQVASRFLNGVPASPWTASGVDSLSLKATN